MPTPTQEFRKYLHSSKKRVFDPVKKWVENIYRFEANEDYFEYIFLQLEPRDGADGFTKPGAEAPTKHVSQLLCTLMARQTYCTSICGSGKYGVPVAQWLAHPICGAWRRVTILNPVSLINILNSMKSPLAENTKV